MLAVDEVLHRTQSGSTWIAIDNLRQLFVHVKQLQPTYNLRCSIAECAIYALLALVLSAATEWLSGAGETISTGRVPCCSWPAVGIETDPCLPAVCARPGACGTVWSVTWRCRWPGRSYPTGPANTQRLACLRLHACNHDPAPLPGPATVYGAGTPESDARTQSGAPIGGRMTNEEDPGIGGYAGLGGACTGRPIGRER